MNFFYDLFKSNTVTDDNYENNSLISSSFDNINNMCMSIDSTTSIVKKNREYNTEFINYTKVKKHDFKLYISENNLYKHKIIKSTNYYNNISGDYYIEFIKDLKLYNNQGSLSIIIKDEYEKN